MNLRKFLPLIVRDHADVYFDSVFSHSSYPAMLLSPNGNIRKCNTAALTLYELEANQIIDNDYFEVCRKYSINPGFNSYSEMVNPVAKTAITYINSQQLPKTIQWVTLPAQNDKGLTGIYLLGIDISFFTSNSNIAKLLQDSIIDHIPNHYIFWKDRNSVYLGCNTALALSVGLKSSAEIVGKTDFDLPTTKEESEFYRKIDKEVMESGQSRLNIEEPQTLSDGTKRILLTSKVPLFNDNDEVYGVLAIYSDITQQKLVEQNLIEANKKLEQAIQVKSEFIRNISHDIRTPLSGIQQATQMIAEGKIPEIEIKEYANSAWEASKKLMDLFNQIIDATKKEDFAFEDRVIKFDLHKLIEDLDKTYQIVARSKDVTLDINCANDVPQYLLGMNLRLHRILMNLLGNALKFTEKGKVKLHIAKMRDIDDKVILKFSIIDTGIGIPEDQFGTIFEKFTKLKTSFQGHYTGYGLGLFVVKEYVEIMQGEIYVDSKPGQGTTFSCILPFKKPLLDNEQNVVQTEYPTDTQLLMHTPAELNISSKETVEIQNTTDKKFRVLLVEDDRLMQTVGIAMLKSIENYVLNLAKSGEEAIELTTKTHYDVVYMDIGLPGINGIEAVKQIRENSKNRNQNTFITALTAHADEEIAKQCLDAGMQQVLISQT